MYLNVYCIVTCIAVDAEGSVMYCCFAASLPLSFHAQVSWWLEFCLLWPLSKVM